MFAKKASVLVGCVVGLAGCYVPEGRSFVAFDRMTVNGISSQQTLWDMYFEPNATRLTDAGQERLAWILSRLDRRDPRIYVQTVPGQDERTHARIETVTAEMKRYPGGAMVVAVLPTKRTTVRMMSGEVLRHVVEPGQPEGDVGARIPHPSGSTAATTGDIGTFTGATSGSSGGSD